MELNKELLEKAKSAKSAEELEELVKAEGAFLPAGEAEKLFAGLHKSGELVDEELDNVTGGGCSDPDYKFDVGDRVAIDRFCRIKFNPKNNEPITAFGSVVSRGTAGSKGIIYGVQVDGFQNLGFFPEDKLIPESQHQGI